MKTLLKSIKITLAFCVLFSVCYIFVLWLFARIAGPNGGEPEVVIQNGQIVGASHIGQRFTKNTYFWGRPSLAGNGYDASSSGGSNKGPTSSEYLAEVNARIDTFLMHHPYVSRKEVPAEMVTASASGLDPDITPACAYVQIKRIAMARSLKESDIKDMVDLLIRKPLLGLWGTETVNVLNLNIALDQLSNKHSSKHIKDEQGR